MSVIVSMASKERTQLNVNINAELLKTLKQNAIKSGMTLTNYVTQLIKVYVSKENIAEESDHVSTRIENVEYQLHKINEKLLELTKSNTSIHTSKKRDYKKITGFSEEGAKACNDAVIKYFEEEITNRNISLQEAVIEITPHIQSSFDIKYWSKVLKMFSEKNININAKEMYDIYTESGNKCPICDMFYKWSGKKPKYIEDMLLEAANH